MSEPSRLESHTYSMHPSPRKHCAIADEVIQRLNGFSTILSMFASVPDRRAEVDDLVGLGRGRQNVVSGSQ